MSRNLLEHGNLVTAVCVTALACLMLCLLYIMRFKHKYFTQNLSLSSCFLSCFSRFLSPTWPRLSLPCCSLKARSSWGPKGPGTWRWMTWKTMMTISSPPRNHWRTREGWAQRKGGLGRGQLAGATWQNYWLCWIAGGDAPYGIRAETSLGRRHSQCQLTSWRPHCFTAFSVFLCVGITHQPFPGYPESLRRLSSWKNMK